MNMDRFERSLKKLNEYTIEGKDVTRLAYSKEEKYAKNYIIKQLQYENMTVKMDAVGNVIARREGLDSNLPPVAFGSHIDSVYEAGRFDGALGVIAALEIIRYLNEENIMTKHPLEVIIFTAEESSRFGISTIGSGAMAGRLNLLDHKHLKDRSGISLEHAFQDNHLQIEHYEEAIITRGQKYAFIELHIEQGPVLEIEGKDIGIVKAIAAPLRLELRIKGEAGHSGTTPFKYRKDALTTAAEITLEVEHSAKKEESYGTVATVGVLDINPGAMNIVPGEARMQIDIRSVSNDSKNRVYQEVNEKINEISKKRNIEIKADLLSNDTPVNLSENMLRTVEKISNSNQYTYKVMNSGAGHDAMHMAYLCPTALIFVPSVKGISHQPEEFTEIKDIEKGLIVMKDMVIQMGNGEIEI